MSWSSLPTEYKFLAGLKEDAHSLYLDIPVLLKYILYSEQNTIEVSLSKLTIFSTNIYSSPFVNTSIFQKFAYNMLMWNFISPRRLKF